MGTRLVPRSINIFTGEQDYAWIKAALEELAEEVLPEVEAQRGAKVSKLIVMIASATGPNFGETARLLKEIKRLIRSGH